VPFTTNAGQNPGGYSEQVPVKLTQGAVGSLPLLANIGAGLDINITVEVSIGGYVAPSLKYQRKGVPTCKPFSSKQSATPWLPFLERILKGTIIK
jgi:hypothetical protein